jgi:transposase-like protein
MQYQVNDWCECPACKYKKAEVSYGSNDDRLVRFCGQCGYRLTYDFQTGVKDVEKGCFGTYSVTVKNGVPRVVRFTRRAPLASLVKRLAPEVQSRSVATVTVSTKIRGKWKQSVIKESTLPSYKVLRHPPKVSVKSDDIPW